MICKIRGKIGLAAATGVCLGLLVALLLIPQAGYSTSLAADGFHAPQAAEGGARQRVYLPAQAPAITSEDYIVLISGLYAIDGDVERARARLAGLGLPDPGAAVADLAERFLQEGRGDVLVVDLATLARALGAERAGLLPYVATPTPAPAKPQVIPGGLGPGTLPPIDWDIRLSAKLEPPVKLAPAEVQSGQTYWRLIRAYWQSPEEGHDKYHIFANVLNKDGVPITQPIVVENGGKLVVQAEPKPDSEYLINFPMNGTLGSYTVYVAGDTPSDRIVGLGLGFAKGGKDHTCFLLTFQETVAP